jgi:hypothetical protein
VKADLTGKSKEAANETSGDELSAGRILIAFEKLFGGGRGVKKFSRSGLRYVNLTEGAILVEQNPQKRSEWAELANEGHRIAWVMRDGEYLARVVDGEVVMLVNSK